eukprot:COSAG02_NODE_3559_length_6563_cov_4.152382_13_plen_66_part_01
MQTTDGLAGTRAELNENAGAEAGPALRPRTGVAIADLALLQSGEATMPEPAQDLKKERRCRRAHPR